MRGSQPNHLEAKKEKLPLTAHPEDELWSFKTVVVRTGLSRSSIYSYIAQGHFHRQRRVGLRRVGWLASEVRSWIRSRPFWGKALETGWVEIH